MLARRQSHHKMHKPRKSPKALSMTLNSTKFSHSNAPTHYLEKILQKKQTKKHEILYDLHQNTCDPPLHQGAESRKGQDQFGCIHKSNRRSRSYHLPECPKPWRTEGKPSPRPVGQSCSLQASCKPSTQRHHEQELPQQLCRAGTRQSSTCSLLPPPETQLRKPQPWPLGLLPAPQHRN